MVQRLLTRALHRLKHTATLGKQVKAGCQTHPLDVVSPSRLPKARCVTTQERHAAAGLFAAGETSV
jgi:hypothetical protein